MPPKSKRIEDLGPCEPVEVLSPDSSLAAISEEPDEDANGAAAKPRTSTWQPSVSRTSDPAANCGQIPFNYYSVPQCINGM
jgi:hypothetical protein